jgi:hypothetical protein
MSKTKKLIIKFIIGYFVVCAIVGVVCMYFFTKIREDPIDNVAMPYLWDEEAITEQVGADIKHINRHLRTEEGTRRGVYVTYSIEFYGGEKWYATVRLDKEGEEWVVLDYGLKEEPPK